MSDSDKPTRAPPFDPTAFARKSEALHGPTTERSAMERTFGRFGTMTSVPWIVVSQADLRTMPLDHRAGFVLSHIDGTCNVEMLVDVSGMPLDEALGILIDLISLGVVVLR